MNKIRNALLLGCGIFLLASCTGNENAKTPVNRVEYKTDSVKVNGNYFTYRKTGTNTKTAIPLILFIHTRGNLDSWDGALIEKLASERTVITFNNRGVASSGGQTPESFALMAEDGYQFIKALGYDKVDVLGFSIGGCVAQELLVSHNEIVRNAILAGTSPKGATSINQRDPKIAEMVTRPTLGLDEFLALFFNASDKSRELGKAFWERKQNSKYPKDVVVSKEAAKAQAKARLDWGNDTLNTINYKNITNPVLVANGKVDVQMPTHNSVDLYNLLPNAQLNLYPDAGHGFLFQYPEIVGSDINRFLNSNN
ncbi:alpha/beta fold hydrolase [Epilithonimonas hungarica]|uniref:Pimeloyl-ACP methyl ester carboxylesterase n=1 Tax=Epilithonimonas hungarica TaxID=454006 RepID=A0A1G7S5A8_9FLAO|nr:alpha/beta hydrolase [Epilithonimonas hungarica]SDG18178.1 Pimeloyl-ACP methyl ester carboxylesterase [Epilithonimonas hungarica]